jgi:hypothetical protein
MRRHLLLFTACCTVAGAPDIAHAQLRNDSVTIAAGSQYDAGALQRFFVGENWRPLWLTPIRVPVLDMGRFAGGLTPERQGGGNQSITLHMSDPTGRTWLFRSVDKFLERGLPDEMRGHVMGDIVADHVSMLHPGGTHILPALLKAAGVLHVQPQLYVMPDDPRLGEFREQFAGMLGSIEERPNNLPDGEPGFAGSIRIRNSENFLDDLEDSQANRLDEAEFLRARLVDFLVGDPDRGTDQWRWARFGEDGAYTWRPIPLDRDWALARGDGFLARLARGTYGKLVRFSERPPSMRALTFSSHILDRRLLTRLTRAEVLAEAGQLRNRLTDDVIAEAVSGLPPEYRQIHGAELQYALRARRDSLPMLAAQFYAWLASDVDVRGTDERDIATIERRPDGTVHVRIEPLRTADDNGGVPSGPFFERLFLPAETREVRVYLHGGDDHARVIGTASGPIVVRVIGGGGDDVLEDLAGGTRFYDHRGDNTVVRSAGTLFHDDAWYPPDPPEGLRANFDWAPDWGHDRSVGPAVDYHGRAGPLVGVSYSETRYGFRRLPFHWDFDVRALYAPRTGRAAIEAELDYPMPNSRRTVHAEAAASGLDVFRFHGYGNDTPASAEERVSAERLTFEPSMVWRLGMVAGRSPPDTVTQADDARPRWEPGAARQTTGWISVGPTFGWTQPHSLHPDIDDRTVLQLGAQASAEVRRTDHAAVPRRGFHVEARAAAYPLASGAGAFARLEANGAVYVPLVGNGPHLALRAAGEHAFGEYPFFAAAYIGGRNSLRGLPTDRFAGDAAVTGTAELRMPIDSVNVLLRAELGVLAFGDIGRVWHDGSSHGGWHRGFGGGIWLASLGRGVSAAVAHGESTRFYAWLGLPF